MWSLKRSPIADKSNNAAFDIGMGYVSTKTQRLADGIVENMPLPSGEESVRLRRRDTRGVLHTVFVRFFSVAGNDSK